MNYMWQALINGMSEGVAKEDVHFVPAKIANPYRETFFSDVNKVSVTAEEPIEVNALYRYAAVFEALIDGRLVAHGELRDKLFDILAHYVSELDLREGLSRAVYYAKFLCEDIAGCVFGEKNAESLVHFSSMKQRHMLSGLLRAYQSGMPLKLFAKLLRELYPNSITYLDNNVRLEFLIYIGKKKTDELEAQVQLLCDMLIPADYNVILFWDMHFGLIGIDETMEIGQIMMY